MNEADRPNLESDIRQSAAVLEDLCARAWETLEGKGHHRNRAGLYGAMTTLVSALEMVTEAEQRVVDSEPIVWFVEVLGFAADAIEGAALIVRGTAAAYSGQQERMDDTFTLGNVLIAEGLKGIAMLDEPRRRQSRKGRA